MRIIAFILPNLQTGGVETLSISLAKEFEKKGYTPEFVLVEAKGDLLASVSKNWNIVDLKSKRLRSAIVPLNQYLRGKKPDAMIAALWPLTCVSLIAKIFSGSSLVAAVSEHNTLSQQYSHFGFFRRFFLKLSLMLYRLADIRITVSSGVANDVSRLSGIPKEKFNIIYNPLPFEISKSLDIKEAESTWNHWTGSRVITVGRLKKQKNHLMLIEAFKKLLERMDARLIILGSGELEQTIRNKIQSLALADKVLMPGQTPDPIPFYCSSNLFVLSSDYEGFGNVIIEALACGLPIVSTDCPSGPAEILENGRFGTLTPVGDSHALADAMFNALNSEHDYDALKRRARDFSPDIIANQYLQLLFPDTSSR